MPNAERSLGGPAVGTIPERAYQFILRPRVLHAGIRMFSIPYELSDDLKDRTPEGALRFLFGGNLIRMARWVPEEVRYAIFDLVGSPQEDEATLTLNSSGVAQPPAGAAFWARITEPGGPPPPPEEGGGLTPRGTQVQLLGRSIRSAFYRIRLQPGWNMVGNPYTFRVAYNACIVQLPGQFGTEIVPIQEAVRRGAIRPQIWRFVDGLYTFKTLPDGELIDWEGHWIYSNLAVDFLVPRIRSGFFSTASVDGLLRGDERIAAAAGPGALPHGGWAFPWGAAEECALSRATNAAAAAVQSSKGVRAGRSGRPAAVLRWATHTAPGRAPRPAAGRGDRAI
jgi:hypothetical protein